jgi:hypothetical protein
MKWLKRLWIIISRKIEECNDCGIIMKGRAIGYCPDCHVPLCDECYRDSH